MARVKRSVGGRKKRRKIIALAKGFRGARGNLYRAAREAVWHSWRYAYVGRKRRKRDFHRLWNARINAGARMRGLSYSQFMHGLKTAGIGLNRKMLSELAIRRPEIFDQIAAAAKSGLAG
ncbi:MAG: 50S ribosomal protein L20 [bacterium]|jgi:large subunit ribosomal protein L20